MNRSAIISDKQLGDVTLLEPLTRLLSAKSGLPTALFVNEAFRPLVELMPHAVWGPDLKECFHESWTTSWSSRAVKRTLFVKSQRKNLLANQKKHIRWWYDLIFSTIQVDPILEEYWGHYFWRALGGNADEFESSQLNLPLDDWRHPDLPHEPYILINPTAAWPSKFWLTDSWAKIINTSFNQNQISWVMTGGGTESEKKHCEEIADLSQRPIVSLAGRTSLQQYLYAISRASLVLCVDGSASHLAQAFKVPAITLFGPVYEVKWHWPTSKHRVLSAYRLSEVRPATSALISTQAMMNEIHSILTDNPEIRTQFKK